MTRTRAERQSQQLSDEGLFLCDVLHMPSWAQVAAKVSSVASVHSFLQQVFNRAAVFGALVLVLRTQQLIELIGTLPFWSFIQWPEGRQ